MNHDIIFFPWVLTLSNFFFLGPKLYINFIIFVLLLSTLSLTKFCIGLVYFVKERKVN